MVAFGEGNRIIEGQRKERNILCIICPVPFAFDVM